MELLAALIVVRENYRFFFVPAQSECAWGIWREREMGAMHNGIHYQIASWALILLGIFYCHPQKETSCKRFFLEGGDV